jgi:hypothetical protein
MNDEYDFNRFVVEIFDDVNDVFEFGGSKHGNFMNFLNIENFKEYNRVHIEQHLKEYYEEKNILDEETFRNQLVHVICRCIFEMYKDNLEHDGRF